MRRAITIALVAVLCGCSNEAPPVESTPATVSTDAATPPAASTDKVARAVDLANRGELALRAQQLFAPPEGNAFELFLQAVELDPGNTFARTALNDLLPYAVLHVEQRTASADLADAERVLVQIERAAPQAPSLARLQRVLLAARRTAEQAQERAAAITNAPAIPVVAAPAATEAPAPSVAASLASPLANEPATAASASATAASAGPVEAPATPTAPSVVPVPNPVSSAVAAQPAVVFRPALRYPPQAQRRGIEGRVELEFTIAADGSVSDVVVARSEPEGIFDREAIGSMQRWRFAPPPTSMRAKRVLEFKLAE
jgi:protein TonB